MLKPFFHFLHRPFNKKFDSPVPRLLDLLVLFSAYLTFSLALNFFCMILIKTFQLSGKGATVVQQGCVILSALSTFLIAYFYLPQKILDISFSWKTLKKNVTIAFFALLLVLPTVALIDLYIAVILKKYAIEITETQSIILQIKSNKNISFMPFCFCITYGFLIPIQEEILFRGLLLKWLSYHLPFISSNVISSIIFACMHFSFTHSYYNISLLTCLFTFSLFLGYLWYTQKNILAPTALHAAFNLFSLAKLLV